MLGWRRGDSRGLCAAGPGPGPGRSVGGGGAARAATAAPQGHAAVPEAVLKRCSPEFCAVPAGPWRSIFFLGLSVVEPRVGSHCCAHTMLVALLLPFPCLLSPAATGRLLVIPMEGSHWLSMKKVLVELSKRGHQIVVIAPDSKILIDSSDVYELKTYSVPLMKEDVEEHVRTFIEKSFSQEHFLRQSGTLFHASCKSLLQNQELLKYIGEGHFDALLTDPVSPCGQIIALHFSIPSVFFLRMVPCALEVRAAQGPDPPSYVPRGFSEYTDHMTFSQRVKNFLIVLSESFICNIAYSQFEELASEFLQKPMTMTEILSHGSIWLRRIDFVFEYPMPVMPNMVFIGGIHCGEKKKPLSQVTGWQPGRGCGTHKPAWSK
ncbi:UDP-glucuronosyltransferase 1A1-like [Zonotrichia leucophrys gambelii]|uniref:UDP-glucuronosyltransferase 1A1-like n=1 Tax=Zonotrichia leucophrys gambelii TaxID=257770 RepID=UPI0031405F9C